MNLTKIFKKNRFASKETIEIFVKLFISKKQIYNIVINIIVFQRLNGIEKARTYWRNWQNPSTINEIANIIAQFMTQAFHAFFAKNFETTMHSFCSGNYFNRTSLINFNTIYLLIIRIVKNLLFKPVCPKFFDKKNHIFYTNSFLILT